jgi:hypothetical protein
MGRFDLASLWVKPPLVNFLVNLFVRGLELNKETIGLRRESVKSGLGPHYTLHTY